MNKKKNSPYKILIPLFVFIICISITFSVWSAVRQSLSNQLAVQFDNQTKQITTVIDQRIHLYANVAYGAQALFSASETVENDEWIAYVRKLEIAENYPGISAMIYIKRVPSSATTSFPYQIYPASEKNDYYPFTYIATSTISTTTQKSPFGFDASSDPLRYAAMEKAVGLNLPRASAIVPTATTRVPSFGVYAPIFANNSSVNTYAERQEALQGFVYIPFVISMLFSDLSSNSLFDKNIDFSIYDVSTLANASADNFVYSTEGQGFTTLNNKQNDLSNVTHLNIDGRDWTISFTPKTNYELQSLETVLPNIILLLGTLLSALLSIIVYFYASSREKAAIIQGKARDDAILGGIGDAVFAIDIDENIILYNHTTFELSGFTEAEALGKPYKEILRFMPDGEEIVQDDFIKEAMSGKRTTMKNHTVLRTKNGKLVPVADSAAPFFGRNGKVEGVVVVFRDTTKEREIEFEKLKYEAILSSIGDGVAVADPNGKLIYWNEAAETILGMKFDSVVKEEWAEHYGIFYPDEKTIMPGNEQALAKVLKGQTIPPMQEFVRNANVPNGRHIMVHAKPLQTHEGELMGGVAIFRDISKEKEIDKAKTEFVSLASHQLRTPLTAIRWYVELLQKKKTIDENETAYIKELDSASRRMADIIDSLLNISRIELGTMNIQPEHCNIEKISNEILNDLDHEIQRKNITLTKKSSSSLEVFQDRMIMANVLQNLLSNAVKYTPPKGNVELQIFEENENVIIKVSDTGFGIPQYQKDKIFSKMFRADNARQNVPEGNGLGLYTVRALLTLIHGSIWFETEENKGSVFYAKFPKHNS